MLTAVFVPKFVLPLLEFDCSVAMFCVEDFVCGSTAFLSEVSKFMISLVIEFNVLEV